MSFLSTVVRADISSQALSYQQAVALIREELGDTVRVEHLARKQLPDGAVHLIAYVGDADSTLAVIVPKCTIFPSPFQNLLARGTCATVSRTRMFAVTLLLA